MMKSHQQSVETKIVSPLVFHEILTLLPLIAYAKSALSQLELSILRPPLLFKIYVNPEALQRGLHLPFFLTVNQKVMLFANACFTSAESVSSSLLHPRKSLGIMLLSFFEGQINQITTKLHGAHFSHGNCFLLVNK